MRCCCDLLPDCQAICRKRSAPFASPQAAAVPAPSRRAVAPPVPILSLVDYSRVVLGVGLGSAPHAGCFDAAAVVVGGSKQRVRVRQISFRYHSFKLKTYFQHAQNSLPTGVGTRARVLWQHQPSLPISLTRPQLPGAPHARFGHDTPPSPQAKAWSRSFAWRKDSGFRIQPQLISGYAPAPVEFVAHSCLCDRLKASRRRPEP